LSKISPIKWKLDTSWAAVADEHADALAGFRLERVGAGERGLRAIEQHVGRVLVDGLLHVEGLVAFSRYLPTV
jgi:hypothetical protein